MRSSAMMRRFVVDGRVVNGRTDRRSSFFVTTSTLMRGYCFLGHAGETTNSRTRSKAMEDLSP